MDKTVVKAFRVLERLVEADGSMSVTSLAAATRLQKSNVHRLLATLSALGYVQQDASRLYEPSLRVWEIGQRVYSRLGIATAARPCLRELVERTGESAHLALFDHNEIVYIDRLETQNPVRAYTVVGGRAPAYCTASGKALLAYQPETVVRAVARSIRRLTDATITDFASLQKELASVRSRGVAVNIGEFRANVAGLAAPIRGRDGEVIAAVGISGPLERLRPRHIRQLAPKVVEAATAIGRLMGGGGR